MELYNKYRPERFKDILENKETVSSLISILERNPKNIPHAFLFTGPHGSGKTTMGRLIAKELGHSIADFNEVDSAHFRGVDTVRDIRRNMHLAGLAGGNRIWLLDEVHQMTKDAQHALLKALEGAPKHVYFILCTTEPEKLIKTIVSRCLKFEMSLLQEETLTRLVLRVGKKEGKNISNEVAERIAINSLGHARDALMLLDKVIDLEESKMLGMVEEFARRDNQIIDLCRALIKGEKWVKVSKILEGLRDQEPETIRRAILGYAATVLLRGDEKAYNILYCFEDPFYDSGRPGLIKACYESVNDRV